MPPASSDAVRWLVAHCLAPATTLAGSGTGIAAARAFANGELGPQVRILRPRHRDNAAARRGMSWCFAFKVAKIDAEMRHPSGARCARPAREARHMGGAR